MIKNEVLRALQKIGGIFSALKVEVVVGGDSAYTDGKSIHIPVPKSDVDFSEVTALLLHEAGHVRFTDFEAGKGNTNRLLHTLVNALEDPRIEKKMSEIYGGAAYLFRKEAEEVSIPGVSKGIPYMNPITLFSLWVLTTGFSAMGNDVYDSLRKEVRVRLETSLSSQKLKSLSDLIVRDLPRAKNTWNVIELAKKVFDAGVEELRENLIYKPFFQKRGDLDKDSLDSDSNSGVGESSGKGSSSSSPSDSETDSLSEGNQDKSSQEGCQDDSSPVGDESSESKQSSENTQAKDEESSAEEKSQSSDSSDESEESSSESESSDSPQSSWSDEDYVPLRNIDRDRWDDQLEDEGFAVEQDLIPDPKARLKKLADEDSACYGDIYVTKRVEDDDMSPFNKNQADSRLDRAGQLKNLKSILQKFLISKKREFCYLGDSGKKVDTRRLARIGLWNTKVFRKKDVQPGVNTGIILLADTSGSVCEANMEDEYASCLAISQALMPEREVKVGFYTFSDECKEVIPLGARSMSPYLTRIGTEPERMGTDLAKALNTVEVTFTMNPNERQTIIVLTDGIPNDYWSAKEVSERLKSKGCELYGLYIGDEEMCYPDLFTTVQNVKTYEEVPQALMEFSKRILR